MRSAFLLLAVVIGLSGCANVAQGAAGPSAADTTSTPSAPSAPASAGPSPAAPTSSTSPTLAEPAEPAEATASPAPVSTPAPTSDPAPPGSFVLSDSIGLSAAPLLSRYGYPVTGRVGQSAHAAFLEQHLSSAAAQSAPGWVIVLGTNNRGDESDVARVAEWIDVIAGLRTPGAKQQVFWVTPHRPEAYTGSLSRWSLAALNDELERLAGERRWLHVLDFDAEAAAHPEWFTQDGGRLHPDRSGQEALAALIAGGDARPAARSAPVTALEWPSPTPSPSPTPESTDYEVFDNDAE